jgi:hypothetical protein
MFACAAAVPVASASAHQVIVCLHRLRIWFRCSRRLRLVCEYRQRKQPVRAARVQHYVRVPHLHVHVNSGSVRNVRWQAHVQHLGRRHHEHALTYAAAAYFGRNNYARAPPQRQQQLAASTGGRTRLSQSYGLPCMHQSASAVCLCTASARLGLGATQRHALARLGRSTLRRHTYTSAIMLL